MAGIEYDPSGATRKVGRVHDVAMARLHNLPDPEEPYDPEADHTVDRVDDPGTSDEHPFYDSNGDTLGLDR
jgi:hypothetical protein